MLLRSSPDNRDLTDPKTSGETLLLAERLFHGVGGGRHLAPEAVPGLWGRD